jgi:hypothetical protein
MNNGAKWCPFSPTSTARIAVSETKIDNAGAQAETVAYYRYYESAALKIWNVGSKRRLRAQCQPWR